MRLSVYQLLSIVRARAPVASWSPLTRSEARFLENSRVPYEVAHDRARLKLNWEGARHEARAQALSPTQLSPPPSPLTYRPHCPAARRPRPDLVSSIPFPFPQPLSQGSSAAPEYDDGSQRAPSLPIEGGVSLEKAAAAIKAHALGASRVLEIQARDLSALCGFEDLARSQKFDHSVAVAFQNHVAICGEEDNILPVANWDPVKLPLNCTQGYGPPEALRSTVCKRTHCDCKTNR